MKYEYIKDYIIEILKKGIIYREDRNYFHILRNEKLLKEFFREKFSYELIFEREIIKLERITDSLNTSYGIEAFNKQEQYIIFLLILDFLEELDSGRTVLISDILTYITDNYPEAIDWKNYYLNLSLIRVLRYCTEVKILNLLDGSEQEYLNNLSEEAEILYENTGISKYFMIYLPLITENLNHWQDYFQLNKTDEFMQKLCFARRELINNTIINFDNPVYEIIQSNKEILENEFNIYFSSKLVVTDRFIYLLSDKSERSFSQSFPDTRNITTVAFVFCNELKHRLKTEYISDELIEILGDLVENNKSIISNENKRKNIEDLLQDILTLLNEINIVDLSKLESENKVKFSDFIYHIDVGMKENEENN